MKQTFQRREEGHQESYKHCQRSLLMPPPIAQVDTTIHKHMVILTMRGFRVDAWKMHMYAEFSISEHTRLRLKSSDLANVQFLQ